MSDTKDRTAGEATDLATTVDPVAALWEHAQTLTVEDDAEVQERILRNILASNSVHNLLTAGAAVPADDVLGIPLRFHAIRAAESEYDAGSDHYLHCDVEVLSNGDRMTISCGARDVVVKLLTASMRGWLPLDARLERAKKATKAGYFPVFIRPLNDDGEPF